MLKLKSYNVHVNNSMKFLHFYTVPIIMVDKINTLQTLINKVQE